VLVLAIWIATSSWTPSQVPGSVVAATGSWTEYHHDDAHTGHDASLPQVTSVSNGWNSAALDAQVYASPLVYNGIVYAATLNNTVYALRQSDGIELWHRNLGAPETGGWQCGNVSPQGILGTGVIDTNTMRIYVTVLLNDPTGGTNDVYRVFGLDLASGAIGLSTLIPTNLGTGFDWTIHQERGAMAVANGNVYVPFGGRYGDCGAYHGWVFAVPTNGAAVTNYYETPGQGAGFWTAGGVAVDDATGNVFATSGNGTSSGCNANLDGTPVYENDAVVRLSPTLAHLDAFVPQDWKNDWCGNDQDLGSAGPMLISSSLLFQAGKWGGGFLLNPNNLGGMDGQLFPTPKGTPYSQAEVCFGNHSDATFGSFAYAAPFVYVECEGRGLVALNVNTAAPSFSQCASACGAPDWHAGGSTTFGPPIVAAGAVWVASGGGGLTAYNSMTGALIFQSYAFGIHRFVTPAEAGGRVFVPSNDVIRSFNMNFGQVPNPPTGSLGGVLISGPGSSAWAGNRADVFGVGTDRGLWHRAWDGVQWSPWQPLGGVITADPSAASWSANRIDVFVRGTDNALWHIFWGGAGWSSWEQLGGILTSGTAASSQGIERLDVFVRGTDNALWHRWFDSGGWHNWEWLGGVLSSDPDSVSWGLGRVDVFVRGADPGLWHRWWDSAGWHNWEWLGGVLTSSPAASSCGVGKLDVFVLGTDKGLWRRSFSGGVWSPWQSLGGYWTSSPAAACRPGTTNTDVYVRASDNSLWHLNY
jgi:outer membrane protein assembly factor BamB